MHIRVTIAKLPDKIKAELYTAIFQTKMIPLMREKSKCLSLKLVDIGEGKIMGIATYNTEAEFEESNKWMKPIQHEIAQSLSAKFESYPGQEIISYEKTD